MNTGDIYDFHLRGPEKEQERDACAIVASICSNGEATTVT